MKKLLLSLGILFIGINNICFVSSDSRVKIGAFSFTEKNIILCWNFGYLPGDELLPNVPGLPPIDNCIWSHTIYYKNPEIIEKSEDSEQVNSFLSEYAILVSGCNIWLEKREGPTSLSLHSIQECSSIEAAAEILLQQLKQMKWSSQS